jgi:uncharacterized SAM-binding protein YcdF (DUF218 family)
MTAVALVVGILLVAVSTLPFLRARTDAPARADAVVLLSGDHGERRPLAVEMLNKGVADTLILVGTTDGAVEGDLCSNPQPFEVICIRLDPDSTRAEARAVGKLAEQRGWRDIVVVTSTYHATRAQMIFRRCIDGSVTTIGARPPFGRGEVARQVIREWLGTVKALTLERGC